MPVRARKLMMGVGMPGVYCACAIHRGRYFLQILSLTTKVATKFSFSLCAAVKEISDLLNTGLDDETLRVCVQLLEAGVNPEALATVVRELRRETTAIKVCLRQTSSWWLELNNTIILCSQMFFFFQMYCGSGFPGLASSPIFCSSVCGHRCSASMYYTEHKPKNKNGGGLGTRLSQGAYISFHPGHF